MKLKSDHKILEDYRKYNILTLSWNKNGFYLIALYDNCKLLIWNVTINIIISQYEVEIFTNISNIFYLHCNWLVCILYSISAIQIHNVIISTKLYELPIAKGHSTLSCVTISQDGCLIVSGASNGEIVVRYAQNKVITSNSISVLRISSDDAWLLAGSIDACVYVWNLMSKELVTIYRDHDFPLATIASPISSNLSYAATTSCFEHTIRYIYGIF